jgi:hypothetical protein
MKKEILIEDINRIRSLMNLETNRPFLNEKTTELLALSAPFPKILKYFVGELGDDLGKNVYRFTRNAVRYVRILGEEIDEFEWDDIVRKLTNKNLPDNFDLWASFSVKQQKFLMTFLRKTGQDVKLYDEWLPVAIENMSKRVNTQLDESEFLDLIDDHLEKNLKPSNPAATFSDALNDLWPNNTFWVESINNTIQTRIALKAMVPEKFVDKLPLPKTGKVQDDLTNTAKRMASVDPDDIGDLSALRKFMMTYKSALAFLRPSLDLFVNSAIYSMKNSWRESGLENVMQNILKLGDEVSSNKKSLEEMETYTRALANSIRALSISYKSNVDEFTKSLIETFKKELSGKVPDDIINAIEKEIKDVDPFKNPWSKRKKYWWDEFQNTSSSKFINELMDLLTSPLQLLFSLFKKGGGARVAARQWQNVKNITQRTLTLLSSGAPKTFDEITDLTSQGWQGWAKLYGFMWGGYHIGFPTMFAFIDWSINWVSLWLTDWFGGEPAPEGWLSDLSRRWNEEVLQTFNFYEIIGDRPTNRSVPSLVVGGVLSFGHWWWDDISSYVNGVQKGEIKSELPEFIENLLDLMFSKKEELEKNAKDAWEKGADEVIRVGAEMKDDFDSSKIGKTIDTLINTPNKDEATEKAIADSTKRSEDYKLKSSESEAKKFLGSKFYCFKYGNAFDNSGLCYRLNLTTNQWERYPNNDNKHTEYCN